MKSVLITGAAGDVGRRITPLLAAVYPRVVLSDMKMPADCKGLEFRQAELGDMAAVTRAVEGIDGIVHLGGFSVEGPWETILNANIAGCYNLFEAARVAGSKRIVFASSNHAVGYYPRSRTIRENVTVLPDSRYGVSKAFGEALGAMYAMKYGLGVTCLRIGNVNETPMDMRRMAIMLHPEDLVQLIRIGLDHPEIVFEVLYGASGNTRAWWDNSRAHELGYRPRHNSESHLAVAEAEQRKIAPEPIGDFFQGGTFCKAEHSTDLARLKAWPGPRRS
jgi:uronate dehydrogenase